jgi:hypothetical protein
VGGPGYLDGVIVIFASSDGNACFFYDIADATKEKIIELASLAAPACDNPNHK